MVTAVHRSSKWSSSLEKNRHQLSHYVSPQTDRLSFVGGSYITDVASWHKAAALCLPLTFEIHCVFLRNREGVSQREKQQ